jgi:hypothetical protein
MIGGTKIHRCARAGDPFAVESKFFFRDKAGGGKPLASSAIKS